ncbi:MAG: T9SS type A sorting domain-containing protein [Candidatus Cloacimonetes bacterium]|nr:T9SS type A sorting domain-containing protein [Candidatus Cloacimonadota bacterium]MDD3578380.1 FlgD immunoglobulin-like domain containing protein [Candidatus Cloacimonadota bacterium]
MKKSILLVVCMSFLMALVCAKTMQPAGERTLIKMETKGRLVSDSRNVPGYTFTKEPTSMMTSFYDYMIGSYNGTPLRLIPNDSYPGYFLTFHGKRTPTGTRRAFYAHLTTSGDLIQINEITPFANEEGFPTLAVDPETGKALYAWHCNADDDEEYEVQFTSDAFIEGISGLFNPLEIIVDNPITIDPPVGDPTADNEFLWPTAKIGPSPVAGMRRVYVAMGNMVSHTFGPSENAYIVFADFNGDMIESSIPLVWNHTTIPELDQWNHDSTWRRPSLTLTADDLGNLYYTGYHFAYEADGSTPIQEPDVDIFKCDNYGEGTWTRIMGSSHLQSWNPAGTPGGTGYFVGDGDVPYPDNELVWSVVNSGHRNGIIDDAGRLIFPGLWAQSTTGGGFWADFHSVKSLIYNPITNDFTVKEIYPIKDFIDTHNEAWTPWDLEAPWGEPEYFPGNDGNQYLNPEIIYPFPHWDESLHSDAMIFHYNNIRITEANGMGQLVAVWQDSRRAMEANVNSDPDYAEFSLVPEIYISYSQDSGNSWSDPIVLNSVEVPEFENIRPMWVYPADKMIFMGVDDYGQKIGKIGFVFLNDFTWGSNAQNPPAHPTNDGGEVMFMELVIGKSTGIIDDSATPAASRMLNPNYPNPFNPKTTISFDMPKAANARLDIYNAKGQRVKTLFDGNAAYGRTSLIWNGTDSSGNAVSSGIYFYRLSTENHNETRKMILMK